MNRTSRLFLMGSGFVLAAGLGTGLVAYYGGGLSTLASAGRAVGPEELRYVPESAAVVAYANVRDVMNSEFRQKIRTVLPDHDTKGQEEFQRETGINIEQDIDYVLAWMTPAPDSAEGKGVRPVGLVLAHGRFDTAGSGPRRQPRRRRRDDRQHPRHPARPQPARAGRGRSARDARRHPDVHTQAP